MPSATAFALALALAAVGQADWYEPFPAHKVVGNVYYVGSKDLASYLITTPEGHILINSGFERTVPLIRKSVESLGFKMARRQDPAGQPRPLRPRRRPRPDAGVDRREGLRHARATTGDRLGRQGPVPLRRPAAGSPARSTASWRTATR